MDPTNNAERPSPEAYGRIVQACQLLDVILTQSSSRRDMSVEVVELTPHIEWSTHGEMRESDAGKVLIAKVSYAFSGGSEDKTVVEIGAEYLVLYALEATYEEEPGVAQVFADHNGRFNTWSFFREHAHSILAKMGLPTYIVPLLKPTPEATRT